MKEASGELNMTVVTILAISAIAGFFTLFLWPRIKTSINSQWSEVETNSRVNNVNP